MDKPHSWHVSEMYSDKYFTKYCENAESVQHGSGLPYIRYFKLDQFLNSKNGTEQEYVYIIFITLSWRYHVEL